MSWTSDASRNKEAEMKSTGGHGGRAKRARSQSTAPCSLIQLLNGYISLKEHKTMLDQEKETRVQNLCRMVASTCQPNNIWRLSSRGGKKIHRAANYLTFWT
ncbi:hypothetical protein F2Q70_00033588 [Brassica cretica]|uniref:Uncharacterized protein n=1 Tax=Brassica cretica TaxID=69181 RepID=A0A8S9FDQ0_BRACR|nr:hypothetical protein F2Q70_00033588 [Brassica cretica]